MSAQAAQRLALIGSPNSGKTTLFNALTGLRQTVANYAGVTVEHVTGELTLEDTTITLIDLPGTYALDPLSPDEQVTLDVLHGRMDGLEPDGVVVVADATTLQRSLQLVGEVMKHGLPTVLILTMIDELKARKGAVKVPKLRRALGIPVVGVVGNKGIGLDDVRALLGDPRTWLQDVPDVPETIEERYVWADAIFEETVTPAQTSETLTDRIDAVVLHPIWGVVIFAITMLMFFQVVFAVAAPLQELFEGGVLAFGSLIADVMPEGLLRSLIVDGVIAGVGGVVVFVPQIALLLLLIAILEGTGYMARAAFVVDRMMGWAGLEGRCFIALLSSFACAIPGIMAARGVPDPKSRLATIMVAPFMTCSARLPVYGLLIGAFVPSVTYWGVFNLQGLVLFSLYLLGAFSALIAATIFKRGLLKGATYPFYMELPPYRLPTFRVIGNRVWRGVGAFLRKAGRVILAAAIVLWALLAFGADEPPSQLKDDPVALASYNVENSYAGKIGHLVEPVIRPLGFDWKIGVGLLASLAAREVIVATLSQIYAFEGGEEDLQGLGAKLKAARRDDGTPAYPLPVVLSLLVYFVYALQCVSTLAVMRRETGGWKWPAIAFTYMSAIAYVAAFATFRISTLLLG